MRVRKKIRLALGLLLLLPIAAAFLCASTAPEGYTKRLFQMRDGLPEQIVQAFAQTPDRHLWIGTTGGLLRFDGARFELFNTENTPELHENSIFSLLCDRSGALWIGGEGGGLARYSQGRFRHYGAAEGLSDGFVRAIAEDHAGMIWVGTDNGLFRLQGEKFVRFDGRDGAPQVAVHAIREDHRGRLWVGGSHLLTIRGGRVEMHLLPGKYSETRVKSIRETSDGAIWVGAVAGLYKLGGDGKFMRVEAAQGTIRALWQASDGALWAGSIGHGVTVFRNGAVEHYYAPQMLPSNTVLNFFEDVEGNLWIGTQAGLLRLSRTPVSVRPLPGDADSDFGTVFLDRDATLWMASSKLFRMRGATVVAAPMAGVGDSHVRNLFRDAAGGLWIGTDGSGLFHQAGGRLQHFTTRQGLCNNFIRVITQSRDGAIWVGADEGVSRWDGRAFRSYQMRDGLSHFSIRAMLEDRRGEMWIGTDRGLSHLRGGVFVRDAATEALRQEKVWAIHEDADGGLWFGARNSGLYRYRDGQVTRYTTANGLASNSIYQILESAGGDFWLSSPGGISLLNRHELDAVAQQTGAQLSLTFYGFSDQAEATEIYGGTQPAGAMGAAGDVWFPSNRGLIHILAHRREAREAPPIEIEEASIDGRVTPLNGELKLGPDVSRLDLRYMPILLGAQDGVRCRYKLEGFDEAWSESSARRVAYYTNLPPGEYTFRVEVFDLGHPTERREARLHIVKRPHFYRTYWFMALCLLATAALVWLVYRLRVARIRTRFNIVLKERERLAREMHDTVIQSCTGVSALLEALSSVSQAPAEAPEVGLLNYARAQMRATIEEARQAVWNLRRGDAASNDFVELVREMAARQSKSTGVDMHCAVSGKVYVLNQLAGHELAMILREALRNVARHAQASRVEIAIDYGAEALTLTVRDDGVGCDATLAVPAEHYGLQGMRERARRIGGEMEFVSEPGAGAQVRVRIPLRAAMVEQRGLDAE